MRSRYPVRVAVLAAALAATQAGCRSRDMTGTPTVVDPERVSPEGGSTEEIYQVSQNVVGALLDCPRLEPTKTYRIVLDRIENSTGIRGYDERLFYNRLLSELTQRAGERFVFLDREAALSERALQLGGEVEPGEVGGEDATRGLAGADAVLQIELLNLRGARTRTIQYDVKLVSLDGQILCVHTEEIKKRA